MKNNLFVCLFIFCFFSLLFLSDSINATNDVPPYNDEGISNDSHKSISKNSDTNVSISNRYVVLQHRSMEF